MQTKPNKPSKLTRLTPSLRQYCAIIFLTLISTLSINWLIIHPISIIANNPLNSYIIPVLLLLASFYIIVVITKLLIGKRHITYYCNLKFPPIIFTTMLISFIYYITHWDKIKESTKYLTQNNPIIFFIMLITVVSFIVLLTNKIKLYYKSHKSKNKDSSKISPNENNTSNITNSYDPNKIHNWNKKDWDKFLKGTQPIKTPADDHLDIASRAENVANTIINKTKH